jgi:hypothetical protein
MDKCTINSECNRNHEIYNARYFTFKVYESKVLHNRSPVIVLYKIGGHVIFIISIGLYHEEIKKEGTSQFLLDLVNPADMHFSCQSDLSVQ